MAPAVDLDWLSTLLIAGATVPALGATVFGYLVLRRRGSLPTHPTTDNTRQRGSRSTSSQHSTAPIYPNSRRLGRGVQSRRSAVLPRGE
jgi:hypothetical protein